MKYTQKKSNDYLKVEFERYLGPVQKWRLFDKLRSIRLYPDSVLVKALYPDDVCIFSSDIIPIQSYRVFVLWCRATFGPAHVCLSSLTVLLSVRVSYICIHAYKACIPISFIHDCIVGSIFRNVTNQVYFKWQVPPKQPFTSTFSVPQYFSLVWSLSQ